MKPQNIIKIMIVIFALHKSIYSTQYPQPEPERIRTSTAARTTISLTVTLSMLLAATATSAKTNVEKYCPVCLNIPETLEKTQSPIWYIFACGHTMCHDDLIDLIKNNLTNLKCPTCRAIIADKSIQKLL